MRKEWWGRGGAQTYLIIREGVIQGPQTETTPLGECELGIPEFKQSYCIIGLKWSLLS